MPPSRIPARKTPPTGPAGTAVLVGKDGPQLIRSCGKRWTDASEELFLDHLATTCNVAASAAAAGFSKTAVNARRRRDPAFAQRWQAAVDSGVSRIEALLLRRAEEALEGWAPDTELPIPPMSIKDAPRSARRSGRPQLARHLGDCSLDSGPSEARLAGVQAETDLVSVEIDVWRYRECSP